MSKGNLYVVSGPSGAGKSTICRTVRKILGVNLATSATTRQPRAGEVHRVDYYFLSRDEFEQKIKEDAFLEYAKVHDNYYGTLKSEVENRLQKGEKVILEIDVQGGLQVKALYPEAHLIFFKTPKLKQLETRLRGRKTDNEATIQLRLKNSLHELECEKLYDVSIVNHTVKQACNELIQIIEEKEKK